VLRSQLCAHPVEDPRPPPPLNHASLVPPSREYSQIYIQSTRSGQKLGDWGVPPKSRDIDNARSTHAELNCHHTLPYVPKPIHRNLQELPHSPGAPNAQGRRGNASPFCHGKDVASKFVTPPLPANRRSPLLSTLCRGCPTRRGVDVTAPRTGLVGTGGPGVLSSGNGQGLAYLLSDVCRCCRMTSDAT